eukprot:TRINITY_DN7418_c0_g1_i1.p1 TRINITY_DN7418_c0_g1~~TRINITY_DN7418_c0_g1_i1.p1  ORF type:complete len:403 (+),score=90.70 TRINITY_DN7418_c0_g1_i1:182-1390(+)
MVPTSSVQMEGGPVVRLDTAPQIRSSSADHSAPERHSSTRTPARVFSEIPGDSESGDVRPLLRRRAPPPSPSAATSVIPAGSVKVRVSRYLFGLVFGVPLLVSVLLRDRTSAQHADHTTVKWANYIGDASFAITGTITAGQSGMDLLGCMLIGGITALGGGTIRDVLLLGESSVFWMHAYDETTLCGACSVATFFLWPKLEGLLGWSVEDEWLFWTDALGVGVFAAAGAHTGWHRGAVTALGCGVCGMVTATFGGMTRDVLCQRPPRILYSSCELYALCGFVAAMSYCIVVAFDDTWDAEGVLLGTWVGVLCRVASFNHFLRLPTFQGMPPTDEPPDEARTAPHIGSRRVSCQNVSVIGTVSPRRSFANADRLYVRTASPPLSGSPTASTVASVPNRYVSGR